jgi:predicted sugar kinase
MGMKHGSSDAVRLQTDILIQFADAAAKGVEDMCNAIAMSFIQSSVRTNPDEVGEALNDNFVCKDSS